MFSKEILKTLIQIVILWIEWCFVTVIDSIVLSCLALHNCSLTIVVLKKHLI